MTVAAAPPPALSSPHHMRLSVVVSLCFLSLIYSLPLVQLASELVGSNRTWPAAFQLIPAVQRVWFSASPARSTLFQRLMLMNDRLCAELRDYETQVTTSAWIISRPRDTLQAVLSRSLRGGNEQVVVGLNGWLFFRPDVEALTGPAFLAPVIARPGVAVTARHADPIPAIQRFAEDLRARGIELMVVPIPSKAAILGQNPRGSSSPGWIHNASFPTFLTALKQNGIAVCDLTAPIRIGPGTSMLSDRHYLKTDSHWNSEGVRFAAQVVAQQIPAGLLKSAETRPLWKTQQVPVRNAGDITRLLGQDQALQQGAAEDCEIQRIVDQAGLDWAPDPSAEVLLLGDSFTNVFSQAELGWGTSAGLAEHLSDVLNRPVDRLALNAGGALASRRELLRQLQQGQDRLAGKQLVIWQFAERELSQGDWQVLPLPAVTSPRTIPPSQVAADMAIAIRGKIEQAAHLPDPASLPYREALLPLHLKSVAAADQSDVPTEIVVYVWGMRERQLTPMAAWKAGQTVALRLVPWAQAEKQYGRFARAELDDPDFRLIDLPTYWGIAD